MVAMRHGEERQSMTDMSAGRTHRSGSTSTVRSLSPQRTPAVAVAGSDGGKEAMAFGQRLRELRLHVGLSQKRLAHCSTLSVRAIRDLENGRVRQPREDTLHLLADALGLSARQMDWLANNQSLALLAGAAEPAVSGPFIGRDQEMAALTAMLGTEHHRLVAITGIEGVGKTRLALEVAHALEAAEHTTVLWLPFDDDQLRRGREPAGAAEQPTWLREVVRSGPDARRRLVEALGESNALLVLDGARPECGLADIAADLVNASPRLRILVTTRNPAGMPLDTLFPLAPLPVPSSEAGGDPEDVASMALLLAQVRRIQPAFRPDEQSLANLARICRALDGLPAALESAAHWSLVYSLRQLAHQLAIEPFAIARRPHRGPRQQDAFVSLHHTIAALTSRQRDLLATMSRRDSGDSDGYWSVPEAADAMGLSAVECVDDIYHLLVLGLLRRVDHQEVAMFKVLSVVSVAEQNAAA
jgi:transcriptional regulator with XRE-family HTH domain